MLLLPLAAQSDEPCDVASVAQSGHAVAVSSTQEAAAPEAAHRDSIDSDGYGNACDADLDNSGLVNFLDLQMMRTAFFSSTASPG